MSYSQSVSLAALGDTATTPGAFREVTICDAQRYLVAARKLQRDDVDGYWGPKSKAAMAEYVRSKGLTPVSFGSHENYRGTGRARMRLPNAYLAVLPAQPANVPCSGGGAPGSTGPGGEPVYEGVRASVPGGGATTGGGKAEWTTEASPPPQSKSTPVPDEAEQDESGSRVVRPRYRSDKPPPWGMIAGIAGGFVVLAGAAYFMSRRSG